MANVKLVAESLEEHARINGEQMNEGLFEKPKDYLEKFLKDPEKNDKAFYIAFSKQISKYPNLKKSCESSKPEIRIKLATQSLESLNADPKKMYPWLKTENGKIVGAGSLAAAKGSIGSDLGQ